MGGVRRRLQTLWKKSSGQRSTLVCPECGEEFTAYGDVALEVIVEQYSRTSQSSAESYRETPEDILRLFDHEHDCSAFVQKSSGLPFLSKAAGGFDLREVPESEAEDLDE